MIRRRRASAIQNGEPNKLGFPHNPHPSFGQPNLGLAVLPFPRAKDSPKAARRLRRNPVLAGLANKNTIPKSASKHSPHPGPLPSAEREGNEHIDIIP